MNKSAVQPSEDNSKARWAKRTLSSLAEYHNGAAFGPNDWREEGLPIIRIEQINNPDSETNYFDGFLPSQNIIDDGDLVFSWSATLKVVIWKNGAGALNQHLYKVVPKSFIDKHLLRAILDFNMDRLSGQSQGSTMKHVTRKELDRFEVEYPEDLRYQQKIAHILQTVDQAIEKTEQLIEKYQQIKAGLMHDLFTRGIGTDGQLRPPREQAPELYQHTPIGWIPKEWELLQLSHMAVSGVPVLKTGPFGSSLKGEHWVDDGVPVITIGSLGDDEFIQDELLFISERYAEVLNEYRMKDGQIVFSRVADVGRSVVIREPQSGWVMSSNMMRIHLDHSVIQPEFLQKQLSSLDSIKTQIRCRVNSGGREVANSEILNSLQFVCPSINEQQMIIDRSDLVGARLNTELDNLQKLLKQKSGLMHDLLTGTVPVSVDPGSEVNT